MSTISNLLSLAIASRCFLRMNYRLPNGESITLAILLTHLDFNSQSIKAYVYDFEHDFFYTDKPLTYRINQINSLVLMPLFKTISLEPQIPDVKQDTSTVLQWIELLDKPVNVRIENLKNPLDVLPKLTEILLEPTQTPLLLKTVLSIRKNHEIYPLLSHAITIDLITKSVTESDLIAHASIQSKNGVQYLNTRLNMTEAQIISGYLNDTPALIELLNNGLTYDETLDETTHYCLVSFANDSATLNAGNDAESSTLISKSLVTPLSKHHLKHTVYNLSFDVRRFDLSHASIMHYAFKHPIVGVNIDYGFKMQVFLEQFIENILLNQQSALIVVNDSKEKQFITKQLHARFALLINPADDDSINRTLDWIRQVNKNALSQPALKSVPIESMTQHFEQFYQFKTLLEWIEVFEKEAFVNEQFNTYIQLSSFKTNLLKAHPENLSIPYDKWVDSFEDTQTLQAKIRELDYALLSKLSYTQYKAFKRVLDIDPVNETQLKKRVENFKTLFKTKRFTEILRQIFNVWVVDRNDYPILKYSSPFDHLIVVNAEKMPLYQAYAWFKKAEHTLLLHHGFTQFDTVSNTLYQTFVKSPRQNFNQPLTSHLYNTQNFPYFNCLNELPKTSNKVLPLCIVESLESKHLHHVEEHLSVINKLIIPDQKTAIMTVFNHDYRVLKKMVKKNTDVTVVSVHQTDQTTTYDHIILNIPVHLNTSSKTYDWLKNNQSLLKLLKTDHENISIVVQMAVLKRLSSGTDVLYQLVHKQLQRVYLSNQQGSITDNGVLQALNKPIKTIQWVKSPKSLYSMLKIVYYDGTHFIIDDERNHNTENQKLPVVKLETLAKVIQEIIE